MFQIVHYHIKVDTDETPSLMIDWDLEYCMDAPSIFHMIEYYNIKSQIHNPDSSTYMEAS